MADVERIGDLEINVGYTYDDKEIKVIERGLNNVSKKSLKDLDRIDKSITRIFKYADRMIKATAGGEINVQKAQEKVVKLKEKELSLEKKLKTARQKMGVGSYAFQAKTEEILSKGKTISGGQVYSSDETGGVRVDAKATASYLKALIQQMNAEQAVKDIETQRTQNALDLKNAINELGDSKIAEEIQKQAEAEEAARREAEERAEAARREVEELDALVGKLHEQQEAERALAKQKIQETFEKAAAGVKKFGNQLKKVDIMRVISQIFLLKRAWTTITNFTEAASEWVENLNLLETVFGNASEEAKEFVSTLSGNFGLNENTIAGITATFKQMANSMGQAAETGTQLSKTMTLLALDLSSLRDMNPEDVAENLVSGISGQSRAVLKYGSNITQDAIDEWLKANDIYTSSLSQQDKQIVRSILLVEQQRDSWGDLAKTINTFANQQRIMNDQWEMVKKNLGNILIGTFDMSASFEEASETAGLATKAIWWMNGALIALNEVLSAIIPSIEKFNSETQENATDVVDAYNEVEDAANGALASFDTFNTLGGGNGGLGDAVTSAKLLQKLEETSAEYSKTVTERLEKTQMFARDIANIILKKVFPSFEEWLKSNPDGVFADWAKQSGELGGELEKLKNTLWGIVQTVLLLKNPVYALIAAWAKSTLSNPEQSLEKISNITREIGDSLVKIGPKIGDLMEQLVPLAIKLIEIAVNVLSWAADNDLLEASLWAIVGVMGAFKIAEFAGNIIKVVKVVQEIASAIGTLSVALKDVGLMALAAVSAFAAFSVFDTILDAIGQMSPALQTLAGAILTVAAAFSAMYVAKQAAMGNVAKAIAGGIALGAAVAGIIGTIKGLKGLISAHADGGFQTGGLFYAGEKGPEWVGRQGNTATIMNDSQMSDIMRDSVAQGVKLGMASSAMRGGEQSVANVYLDGNKVGTYVAGSVGFRNEANRRNTGLNWR